MEKATQELGRYIPSLTTIYNSDGIAIHTNINLIVYIDLEKSYSNLDSLVKDVSQYDLNQPFDLVQGDLMRIYTAYDSRQKYWYIFLSFSALVSDGWSFSLLLKTLMLLYGREYDKLENLQEKIFTRKKIISGAQNNELTKISINLDAKNINYKSSAQTKSQYYESVIKEVLKRYKFAKLLRYEDKRNQYDNVPSESVGYYVDYTTINLNINSRTNNDSDENSLNTSCTNTKIKNNLNAVYVYENYPKDIENELKSAKIPHFHEFGEWRRPILPPKIDFGIYVEESENIAKITCYAKPQKWTKKEIKRVLKAIIQQLRDS